MTYELAFSMVGLLSFAGWGCLVFSPLFPIWSDRIAGWVVPAVLAVAYIVVAVIAPPAEGGFDSFAAIQTLFAFPGAVLSGWIHFLAFDLVVGAWVCRTARRRRISFWLVLPCLPVVFLFGPAGFLLFAAVAAGHRLWRGDRSANEGSLATG